MHLKTALTGALVVLTLVFSSGQDKSNVDLGEDKYEEEDLERYASLILWTEGEKKQMTEKYNLWIRESTDIDAPRFLAIKRTKGDSVRLKELNLSVNAVSAYKQISAKYDSMTGAFKEQYVLKIKSDLGANLYNELTEDLGKSENLSLKYQAILQKQRQKKNETSTNVEEH